MSEHQDFQAGERWSYRTVTGYEDSRLVVGAVLRFTEDEPIVCCAVTGAPRKLPDGRLDTVTIPFLPIRASALTSTVLARDGHAEPPPAFMPAFEAWSDDPRGLSAFTVPFDGRLDTLIARQMAEIVGRRGVG